MALFDKQRGKKKDEEDQPTGGMFSSHRTETTEMPKVVSKTLEETKKEEPEEKKKSIWETVKEYGKDVLSGKIKERNKELAKQDEEQRKEEGREKYDVVENIVKPIGREIGSVAGKTLGLGVAYSPEKGGVTEEEREKAKELQEKTGAATDTSEKNITKRQILGGVETASMISGGGEAVAAGKAGIKTLSKAGIKQLLKQSGKAALKTGAREGVYGGIYGTATGLEAEKPTAKEVAKSAGIGAATGAVGGAVVGGASPVAGKIIEKIAQLNRMGTKTAGKTVTEATKAGTAAEAGFTTKPVSVTQKVIKEELPPVVKETTPQTVTVDEAAEKILRAGQGISETKNVAKIDKILKSVGVEKADRPGISKLLKNTTKRSDVTNILDDYNRFATQRAKRMGTKPPEIREAEVMKPTEITPEGIKPPTAKVMTEEEYLNSKGAYFMKGADAGMHRVEGGTSKINKKQSIEKVQRAMAENNELRAKYRKEYQAKIKSGELREPTMNEQLIKRANSNPELQSTQAARRILDKKGISWNQAGLSTTTPSKEIVGTKVPSVSSQEPSLKTKGVMPEEGLSSNRYTSPSHLMKRDEILSDINTPIQSKVNILTSESQAVKQNFTNKIKEATNIEPNIRIKSEESLIGKIERYQSKGKSASEIYDTLGGVVKTNTDDITKQIDNIKKNFDVVEVENYFDRPNEWGYKGVNIRVKTDDGLPAEIQIHTPQSWENTQEVHKIYEKWRGKKITAENLSEFNKDKQLSREINSRVEPTLKPSKVAKSIDAKAVEKKLTEGFGEVAGYEPITIKDQSERAAKLMNTDIEKAKRMVLGQEPVESGLKGEMLIKAMEDYATEAGDTELLRGIAKSPLVSETSAHAQAMRLLAERDPDSPMVAMKEISEARAKKVARESGSESAEQAIKSTKNEIKTQLKQSAPTKDAWTAFAESLRC